MGDLSWVNKTLISLTKLSTSSSRNFNYQEFIHLGSFRVICAVSVQAATQSSGKIHSGCPVVGPTVVLLQLLGTLFKVVSSVLCPLSSVLLPHLPPIVVSGKTRIRRSSFWNHRYCVNSGTVTNTKWRWVAEQRGWVQRRSWPGMFLAAGPDWPSQLFGQKLGSASGLHLLAAGKTEITAFRCCCCDSVAEVMLMDRGRNGFQPFFSPTFSELLMLADFSLLFTPEDSNWQPNYSLIPRVKELSSYCASVRRIEVGCFIFDSLLRG